MRPTTPEDLERVIGEAALAGRTLMIRGGATKASIGAPVDADVLDMSAFSGILDYDPAELVLTAGAATPLSEIDAAVAERGQMLAFEPWGASGATIGGVVAAGVSGSRRLSRGSARDHLLGFRAVSGRGEAFVGGSKVVKNVTGYDLPKVLAGSWGRLAAMTEVTVKVLPAPVQSLSVAIEGLDPISATKLMARAMGSQADVAAAAYAAGLTVLRLEGFGPSVTARRTMLQAFSPIRTLTGSQAAQFWERFANPLPSAPIVWRISVAPSRAPEILSQLSGEWTLDWAGGLIWAAGAVGQDLRHAAAKAQGHALLWRAPDDMRRTVRAFHPQPEAIAALEARVRRSFDPMGVFETGRF